MAKKTKEITPAPEEVKIVSIIADYVFLLDNDPTAIRTMQPQALLHAVLPDTAQKTKIMPEGSSIADVWMLKHGNPLSSVDAALYLVRQVEPKMNFIIQTGPLDSGVNLSLKGEILLPEDVRSETLPGALIIALLNYLIKKDSK